MLKCRIRLAGWLGILALSAWGCRKSETPAPPAPPSPPAPAQFQTVARLHWLGRKQLLADTNAAHLAAILSLPETVKLESQTLEKLAFAPWGLQRGSATPTNAPTALLRPLWDDVLDAESFLEIRAATNQPGELAFAIRLPPDRAALWQANLATVFASLTAQKPATTSNGWTLAQTHWPRQIELARQEDWVLLGLSAETNGSLAALAGQMRHFTPLPAGAPAAEFLEADFDARGVSRALNLGWNLPVDWPRVALSVSSRGGAVRTRANLTFENPLQLQLPAWTFPTNLIHEPLISFTAVRGLTKWLDSIQAWRDLPLGAAPAQIFTWALSGIPLQTYLAIPDAEASKKLERLSSTLLERSRQFFATNSFGKLERSTNGALQWVDFPFLPPSIEAMHLPAGEFLVAGWSPGVTTNRHAPDALLAQFLSHTNLVYYDWEITEPRIEAWIYLGQTLRLVSRHSQLPPKGSAQAWLNALAPRLGNCVTAGALTAPNQLTFTRTSSFGFTALELQLLADWLESPDFPSGLHSFNTEPDPRLYQPPARPPSGAPGPH